MEALSLEERALAKIDAARPKPIVDVPPEPAPEYPLDALQGVLGDAARAISVHSQLDAAIAGQSVLAVAALACQHVAEVQTAQGRKPLSLYLLTIALSGDGKSTADSVATAPIRNRERADYLEFQKEMAEWEQVPKSDRPERPINPLRLVDNFTAEGLIRQYREGLPSLGAFSDEAGAVFAGHSFSAEKKLATAAGLSSLWDGAGIRARARASDDRGGLEARFDVRLAAHWLIQPAAAADALNDQILSEQGFWPRVLLACPEAGKPRLYRPFDPESHPEIVNYWKRISELLALPIVSPEYRPVLRFTEDAEALVARYFEAIEKTCRGKGGKYAGIRSWATRSTEHLCRIAGVLAVVDRGSETDISVEEVTAAAALVTYSLDCWMYMQERKPVLEAREFAQRLLKWLREQPGRQASGRAMLRVGPKPRSASLRDAAISLLEGQQLVRQIGHDKWEVTHA